MQSYRDHILAVSGAARAKAEGCLRYRRQRWPGFLGSVEWAAAFHDLGKLHDGNQQVLADTMQRPLPRNHVDAGAAHLIACRYREAAIAVYAHHTGLPNIPAERAKAHLKGVLRDLGIKREVDSELADLLALHRQVLGCDPPPPESNDTAVSGLDRRLILSCLVDADHSDTAAHYQRAPIPVSPETRWPERLAALDRYVACLGRKAGERNEFRTGVYEACRGASSSQLFWACDSPVGSGKTTAVMAYLLRAAIDLGLRHVFVVLPYTSIINQSVKVYRGALCLPGENPEQIVAAHHHLAEFKDIDSRHLTALWQAPVIVTTAVQFFETLGAAGTARLRKLHELPGSTVFIDEAHAAMPVHLWPFMWSQLDKLAREWSCRFVLGSGSLARFWDNPRINPARPEVPLMIPAALRNRGRQAEDRRVTYKSRPETLPLPQLTDWIESQPGPRLVVLNTVQSAAIVAREIRTRGGDVLHLSTALAPRDRAAIVRRIESKLASDHNGSWTLVATSCVEAGLDFDFAVALRERARAASLVQIGGRVNRHAGRPQSTVWDFVTNDPLLNQHPDFEAYRHVVQSLFAEDQWTRDTSDLMTEALRRELIERSVSGRIEEIRTLDEAADFPGLAAKTRVINADTRLVVVDPRLKALIQHRGSRIGYGRLLQGSVQLWSTKVQKLALQPVPGLEGIYDWGYEYDPLFLGVMAGALRMIEGDRDGFLLI